MPELVSVPVEGLDDEQINLFVVYGGEPTVIDGDGNPLPL